MNLIDFSNFSTKVSCCEFNSKSAVIEVSIETGN
jgi:hypothetical protein